MGHHRSVKPGRPPESCATLKLLAASVVPRRNVPPSSRVSKQWPRSFGLRSDAPSRASSPWPAKLHKSRATDPLHSWLGWRRYCVVRATSLRLTTKQRQRTRERGTLNSILLNFNSTRSDVAEGSGPECPLHTIRGSSRPDPKRDESVATLRWMFVETPCWGAGDAGERGVLRLRICFTS
jgi:hypothetical protein